MRRWWAAVPRGARKRPEVALSLERSEYMLQLAQAQPGFIDFTQYTGGDGERLSVIRWKDKETLEAWRNHEKHRVAQTKGRDRWYAHYHLEIAELVRESRFDKTAPAKPPF